MKELLKKNNLDCLWITNKKNIFYLSNFNGTFGEIIITNEKTILISDKRYEKRIIDENLKNIEVIILQENETLFDKLLSIFKIYENIGFEAKEVNYFLYEKFKNQGIKLQPTVDLIENMRVIKNLAEIENIKIAVEKTDKIFLEILKNIKLGQTEKEIQKNLDYLIDKYTEGKSFDSIVCANKNTAKPHATPSEYKICDGDILTLDFGCYINGYCSDMTRTFFVGKSNNEQLKEIHRIVEETLNLQIEMIKPGVSVSEIDLKGRENFKKYNLEKYFVHATGHGIGLDVHEKPRLTKFSDEILLENMIVTIEPGIYIPELGGVRIEQDVLVTKNGFEILNKSLTSYDVYNNIKE